MTYKCCIFSSSNSCQGNILLCIYAYYCVISTYIFCYQWCYNSRYFVCCNYKPEYVTCEASIWHSFYITITNNFYLCKVLSMIMIEQQVEYSRISHWRTSDFQGGGRTSILTVIHAHHFVISHIIFQVLTLKWKGWLS